MTSSRRRKDLVLSRPRIRVSTKVVSPWREEKSRGDRGEKDEMDIEDKNDKDRVIESHDIEVS